MSRSFRDDERGYAYQAFLVVVGLAIFGLLLMWLTPIFGAVDTHATTETGGMRYSGEATEGLGYLEDASDALPAIGVGFFLLFSWAMAVLLSSRRAV